MPRVLRNVVMCWGGRADYKRWTSPDGLEKWWDERTNLLAALIPAGSRVLEFGAGRRRLEERLPAGCTYIPSDLVERGPGTVVLDLNRRPLPDLLHLRPEVAIFGGVLEYVRDARGIAQWLASSGVTMSIASFDAFPQRLGWMRRYAELKRRVHHGYMNHLTEEQLLNGFEAAGFTCTRRQRWADQVILQFSR